MEKVGRGKKMESATILLDRCFVKKLVTVEQNLFQKNSNLISTIRKIIKNQYSFPCGTHWQSDGFWL